MCLLAVLYRVVADAPLVLAANREEAYDRPGSSPGLVEDPVPFVASLDSRAGGAWLGVNRHGLVVAVTNAPKSAVPARPRSRGLLVRDLLQCRHVSQASEQAARELDQGIYAGCNLLLASSEGLIVVHGGDWLRVHSLPPGKHVLTRRIVNDGADRRAAHAMAWLGERTFADRRGWLTALRELCGQTGGPETPPICLHGDQGGTVSSSLVVLGPTLSQSEYWHAQGPPDRTPYLDYTETLRSLVGSE